MKCCFTGHRDIPEQDISLLKNKVKEEIEHLICQGYKTFLCGGALGFDLLCGEIVLEIKEKIPDTELIVVFPCRAVNQKIWKSYEKITERADQVLYLSETYFRGCYHKRNRYMVDHTDFVISYCRKNQGGAYYTIEYARTKGLPVISL
ncbi:MAG: DUF1273 family protein [Clostridia bacterium]|nr:DUF1273 family protein [Clostridia bacterium]